MRGREGELLLLLLLLFLVVVVVVLFCRVYAPQGGGF